MQPITRFIDNIRGKIMKKIVSDRNLMSSFKTKTEFMANQVSLPKQLAWDNRE